MKVNEYGKIFIDPAELFEALYSGQISKVDDIFTDDNTVQQFNQSVNKNKDSFHPLPLCKPTEISLKDFDKENQSKWFMPDNYCPNLIDQLFEQCHTEIQQQRVQQELELFVQHNMFELLFYLKYLVDTMRKHNIVWGVGRGSSVASYVLYLIGVHKIDSIKYELDIKEFLK